MLVANAEGLRAIENDIAGPGGAGPVERLGIGHFNKRTDVSALHRVGGAVALCGQDLEELRTITSIVGQVEVLPLSSLVIPGG